MKIGFVFDDTLDTNDGVQQYIKTLARWLIKNGHDVKFLVGESYDTSEFKERVISLSKNVTVSGNQSMLSTPYLPYINKIRRTIKNENFDILHVQMPYSPFLSQIIIALSDVPKIGTFHTLPASQLVSIGINLLSVIQRHSLDSFSYIISGSEMAKKFAYDSYGIKCMVIPHMVNTNKFKNSSPIKKYTDGKINLLYFGRLVERKGVKYLLKAYKRYSKINSTNNVRLIIAGRGPLKKELESYCKKNKLKNVEFTGYVEEENKASYYATADVCILPAYTGESFGIVLIEAIASGKPIIAGMNPGYSSILKGTGSLLLVDPKNTDLFVEKLTAMIRNRELRNIFGKWSREESKKYSTEKIGQQIIDIYTKAIKEQEQELFRDAFYRPIIRVFGFVFNIIKGFVKMIERFLARRINKSS